jgi:hypothetical protein
VTGARFRFDRLAVEREGARYAVRVELGAEVCTAEARLGAAGAELGAFDRSPPPWAREQAVALLRTVAKNHAADADWPRRVHRWRAPR